MASVNRVQQGAAATASAGLKYSTAGSGRPLIFQYNKSHRNTKSVRAQMGANACACDAQSASVLRLRAQATIIIPKNLPIAGGTRTRAAQAVLATSPTELRNSHVGA